MRVRADGLVVSAALTDDRRIIVKALLETDETKAEASLYILITINNSPDRDPEEWRVKWVSNV